MAQRRQGAIVLQQESPWTQFLGGLGQGVSLGVQKFQREAEQKKSQTQSLMEALMTDKIKPVQLLGDPGQKLLKSMGLDKDPAVQEILNKARMELPPEVAYPAGPPGPTVSLPAQANPELGGYAVNMPGQAINPSAGKINDILEAEDEQKKLGLYELQRKAAGAQQQQNLLFAEDLRTKRIRTLPEQLEVLQQTLKSQGFGRSDYALHYSQEGGLSWDIDPEAVDRIMNRRAKKAGLYTDFETTVSTLGDKRLAHVMRLTQMLESDMIDPKTLTLGDGAEFAWYRAAIAAIAGEKDPKKRVTVKVDKVNAIVNQLNDNIKQYRRVIQSAGEEAGADQSDITDRYTKEITFEDVSGGLSPEEYKKKKGAIPEAGKLISDVRGDYRGSSIASPRSSEAKSATAADNVKKAFDELRDTIVGAARDNPNISGQQVKSVILANRDQIMAEYGLNERLFSLLVAMSDKVLG